MALDSKNSSFRWKPIVNKFGQKLSLDETQDLPEVMRRTRALKKLEFEKLGVDGELNKEILKLIKSKFQDKYQSIYEKRSDIINGKVEPNEEECDFDRESQESVPTVESKESIEGIPGFWLKVLQNFELIREWITKHDESALLNLKDIVLDFNDDSTKMSLEFRFNPNEYFTNEVLTKEYQLEFGPNPQFIWRKDPFYAIKRKGCKIDWKKGKNLIRRSGTPRNISDITSFFCFFETPEEPNTDSKVDDDLNELLWEDWEIAQMIAEKVVPDAVLCYTGDIFDDQSESESSEGEETESASDDSD